MYVKEWLGAMPIELHADGGSLDVFGPGTIWVAGVPSTTVSGTNGNTFYCRLIRWIGKRSFGMIYLGKCVAHDPKNCAGREDVTIKLEQRKGTPFDRPSRQITR